MQFGTVGRTCQPVSRSDQRSDGPMDEAGDGVWDRLTGRGLRFGLVSKLFDLLSNKHFIQTDTVFWSLQTALRALHELS